MQFVSMITFNAKLDLKNFIITNWYTVWYGKQLLWLAIYTFGAMGLAVAFSGGPYWHLFDGEPGMLVLAFGIATLENAWWVYLVLLGIALVIRPVLAAWRFRKYKTGKFFFGADEFGEEFEDGYKVVLPERSLKKIKIGSLAMVLFIDGPLKIWPVVLEKGQMKEVASKLAGSEYAKVIK